MALCSGTPVLSEDGERSTQDSVSMVAGGKPRIAQNLLGMKQIEGGELDLDRKMGSDTD